MSEVGFGSSAIARKFVLGPIRIAFRPLLLEAFVVFLSITVGLAIAARAAAKLGGSDWRFVIIALCVYAAVSAVAICGLHAHPHRRLGLANVITSFRAGLTALIAAALVEAQHLGPGGDESLTWALIAVVVVTLLLDGVDGFAARRQGTHSNFGKRFDMEVDALMVLVLSLLAFASGKAAWFVILVGTMRYGYLAVHTMLPHLPKALKPSFARKAICVAQVVGLCLVMTPPIGPHLSNAIALAALVLLTASFGRDLLEQISRRPGQVSGWHE